MAVIRKALALLCLGVFLFAALTTDLPAVIVVTVERAVSIASGPRHSPAEVADQAVSLRTLALLRAPPSHSSLS